MARIALQNKKNIFFFCLKFKKPKRMMKKNTDLSIKHYKQMNPKPVLFVEGLSKRYAGKKKFTINNLTFNVYPGEFHAFIGANGAGKTTSIKSIIGAYARWSGTILINGQKNTSIEAKKQVGYIPEIARFPQNMSCFSYLVWMAKLSGLKSNDAKKFAKSKLQSLSMWKLRKKNPNTFSSGQKKKILLAQALITNPKILIMDEPAANLDPKARIDLFRTLNHLVDEGKAIFISSHVLAELDKYVNATTILDGGRIVFTGKTKALFERYSSKQIELTTEHPELLKRYLTLNKINFDFNKFNQKFLLNFLDENQRDMIVKHILNDKKIGLLSFEYVGNKLEDIYAKLIKFGSVDTMVN